MAKSSRRRQLLGTVEPSDCTVKGGHLNKIDRRLRLKHKGGWTMVDWTTRRVYFVPPR